MLVFLITLDLKASLKYLSYMTYLVVKLYLSCMIIFNMFAQTHFWGYFILGFPGGSDSKESACDARDPGSIPGSGRSPGEGNGNLLQ